MGVVTGEKLSRRSDFWIPFFLSREVVHGFRVVCWMLPNAMPAIVVGVLVVVSRDWCTIAALRRVTFNLVRYRKAVT